MLLCQYYTSNTTESLTMCERNQLVCDWVDITNLSSIWSCCLGRFLDG